MKLEKNGNHQKWNTTFPKKYRGGEAAALLLIFWYPFFSTYSIALQSLCEEKKNISKNHNRTNSFAASAPPPSSLKKSKKKKKRNIFRQTTKGNDELCPYLKHIIFNRFLCVVCVCVCAVVLLQCVHSHTTPSVSSSSKMGSLPFYPGDLWWWAPIVEMDCARWKWIKIAPAMDPTFCFDSFV